MSPGHVSQIKLGTYRVRYVYRDCRKLFDNIQIQILFI